MSVKITEDEKRIIALLSGEIDHHSAKGLRTEIDFSLRERHPQELILDFSEVTFMDSSGIGILLNRYKQMKASGGTVSFYGASPQILRVLRIGGMLGLMAQYETKEEAYYK